MMFGSRRLLIIAWGLLLLVAGCQADVKTTASATSATPSCNLAGLSLQDPMFRHYDWQQHRDRYPNTNTVATDYFYLVYSWSPGFCESRRRRDGFYPTGLRFQCDSGQDFGWVVHGLWGQSHQGRKASQQPRYCQGDLPAVDKALIKRYLCMSPGARLLQGEWEKHGACDFDTPEAYFAQVEQLHSALVLPDTAMPFHQLFDWMRANNPVLAGRRMERLGKELVICYNKQFQVIDCR